MVVRLSFTTDPHPSIWAHGLRELGHSIKSFRDPLEQSRDQVMVPSIADNFAMQGRPRPWARNRPSTIRRKGHDTVLFETGKLYAAATAKARWEVNSDSLLYGNFPASVEYAEPTNFGFVNNRTKTFVPARQFAMIHPEDESRIQNIFDDWLEMRIDRAMARMRR